MLGGIIHQNLKWTQHIQNDKESLIKGLTTRLNGLRKISKVASFKTRKMLANGIFMSKLLYLMPLWGGCEKYLILSLQKIQNKAARIVTKADWFTPTETLLLQCGWLSVHQLIHYQSLILVFKVLDKKSPVYLYEKLSNEFPYKTRFATQENIRIGGSQYGFKDLSQKSFRCRASKQWNQLPANLRMPTTLKKFKKLLFQWVQTNVPTKPD